MNKTHWKRGDTRVASLHATIRGLESSLQVLRTKCDEIDYYDGLWFLEESEPIFGLAFVAFQNYINSSIYDRFESLEKQYLYYKIGDEINRTNRTDIELIISLANYFKHRDHPKNLTGETSKILKDFNFQFNKEVDIENYPIFKGLELFSENWNLTEILKVSTIWREKLWLVNDI